MGILNKILAGICILIILVIIIGTGLVVGSSKPQEQSAMYPSQRGPTPEEQIQQAQQAQQEAQATANTTTTVTSGDFGSYINLDQIRVTTKEDSENQTTALIILKPWFSYDSTDPAFHEEVATKKARFKALVLEFFSNRTASQLRAMGEDLVKNQLVELANQELVLGKFSSVFFEVYLFFE